MLAKIRGKSAGAVYYAYSNLEELEEDMHDLGNQEQVLQIRGCKCFAVLEVEGAASY